MLLLELQVDLGWELDICTALSGTAAVTAGASTALGAVGFGSSGVVGGSIAASLQVIEQIVLIFVQGLLYAGATPAGGWFATATSAAMGGAMGAAAVATAAAATGVVVAGAAAFGVYKLVKRSKSLAGGGCPRCVGPPDDPLDKSPVRNKDPEKGVRKGGVSVGDHFFRTEEEMVQFVMKVSLEDQKDEENGVTRQTSQDILKDEFECPVCTEVR